MNENKKIIISVSLLLCFLMIPSIMVYKLEANLVTPKTSTSHSPININGNSALDTFFSGDVTDGLSWSTAHVMADLEIDVTGTQNCIYIRNTNRYLIIQECTLSNASLGVGLVGGIYLSNCSNIRITGCTMVDCGAGIILRDDSFDNEIINNNINNNQAGVLIQESINITVSANTIRNSDPGSGIEILDTTDSVISGNTVASNAAGIALMLNSDDNKVSGNTIKNNVAFGIYLDTDAGNNEVYNNCVENNTDANIQDEGQNNNIHDNNCPGIPGYSFFIIIGALLGTGLVIGLIIKKKLRN